MRLSTCPLECWLGCTNPWSASRSAEHEGAGAVSDLGLADTKAALADHGGLLVPNHPRERRLFTAWRCEEGPAGLQSSP